MKVKVEGYYYTGQKKSEGTYKNRELDGLYTEWYENGQKKSETTYKNGELDSLYTEWYRNGQKKSEGNYFKEYDFYVHSSHYDGLLTEWYENGQKKSETTYKSGEKDGLLTGWYENGQKKSETTYKNGKLYGLYTGWYENGQKKSETTYKSGEKDGLHTEWYLSGDINKIKQYYKKDVPHGSQKNYNKKDEVTYHVIFIDDMLEVFVFGDFYRPLTHPKWETSIDKSLKYLKDFFKDGMITEEEYKSFKIDLLKDEKYWNEDGSVKE